MRRSTIAAIAIIAIIVAVVALYFGTRKTADTTASPSPSSSVSAASPASSASAAAPVASSQAEATGDGTITYTGSGFSPTTVTVKAGHKLIVKNATGEQIQVDSNPHPVHTDDPELNIGMIAPGATGTATLTKTGTFGIHNHLDPSDTAKVTIQ